MARPWFRFYRKTVNNPKAQKLRPDLFKAWVNILCATDDNGNLPTMDDLPFVLRIARAKVEQIVCDLIEARLIAGHSEGLRAHDWTDHNYDSDTDPTATARKRKQRTKSRVTPTVTPSNGHANATRTDTDTDTDTELETDKNRTTEPSLAFVGSAGAKPKKGTRWDSSRTVEKDWISDAFSARQKHGLVAIDLELEAEKFAHFWSAKSGANATKLDWRRAFIGWCLKAEGKRSNGMGPRTNILTGFAQKGRAREDRGPDLHEE